MPLRRRYQAGNDEGFNALVTRRMLGDLRVEAMPPMDVRDRFLDTRDGALLRLGLALRLRTQGEVVYASLRPMEGDSAGELASARYERRELEGDGSLPHDTFLESVERFTGTGALETLLRFRQYRTPRALYEGDDLVGVLALDVVADQTAAGDPIVGNEVEIELLDDARHDLMARIQEELEAAGLVPEPFTKFEHGIIRRSSRAGERLLLLPSEREHLAGLTESEAAVERRRARTILMAADGQDAESISVEVGLAPSRVRHWCDTFRVERMHMFDAEVAIPALSVEEEPVPAYVVSELVGDLVQVEGSPRDALDVDEIARRLHLQFASERGGDGKPATPSRDAEGLYEDSIDPGFAQRVDLDQPARVWIGDRLRLDAEALREEAGHLDEGRYARGIRQAQVACRRVSVAAEMADRIGAAEIGTADHAARSVGGALLELAVLRKALELLMQKPVGGDQSEAALCRALARSVWTVEEQRLIHGHGGRAALADQLRSLATAADGAARAVSSARSTPLSHLLASELWMSYEQIRRALEDSRSAKESMIGARCASKMGYLLSLIADPAAIEAGAVTRSVAAELAHEALLGLVATRVSEATSEWARAGGLPDPSLLDPILDAATKERDDAREAASSRVQIVLSSDFRLLLGLATASI